MSIPERRFAVYLHGDRVGHLQQRGAYTRFFFEKNYLRRADRPVLSLSLEEQPGGQRVDKFRLPAWFSNLLPEDRLRRWIAAQKGVPLDKELDLLTEIGHDLSGAVQVDSQNSEDVDFDAPWVESRSGPKSGTDAGGSMTMRFSLAGVTMKFSMVRSGERLTLPAVDERGDWIVKLPDSAFPLVPENEFAMMTLARRSGLDVPDINLVHREDLPDIPDRLWPRGAEFAFAVKRFDRNADRKSVHIEDLAQVRGFYPERKYDSNFQTVGSLVYRGRDETSLTEFVRRMVLNVAVSNSDAHLKNWSLIYRDRLTPSLSPLYDVVSTRPYDFAGLGMPFFEATTMESVSASTFDRLGQLLRTDSPLGEVAAATMRTIAAEWVEVARSVEHLPDFVREAVDETVETARRRFARSS